MKLSHSFGCLMMLVSSCVWTQQATANPWMPPTHTDRIIEAVEPAAERCAGSILEVLLLPLQLIGTIGGACKAPVPLCPANAPLPTPAFDAQNNYIGCDICVDNHNTCYSAEDIDLLTCVTMCNANPHV